MSALQHFFDAERLRRGWSMRETAKRSQISLSKAYAIVNGDDNVEFETFETIAYAFDMTPAELAAAIGKGGVDGLTPDEVQHLAAYRRVPEEQRLAATQMLHGLAVQPTRRTPNQRRDGAAKRKLAAAHELSEHQSPQGENGSSGQIIVPSAAMHSSRGLTLHRSGRRGTHAADGASSMVA